MAGLTAPMIEDLAWLDFLIYVRSVEAWIETKQEAVKAGGSW